MTEKRMVSIGVLMMLALIGVIGQIVPHAPNFAPVGATALFAGFFFRSKRIAILAPAVAIICHDIVLNPYNFGVAVFVITGLMFPVLWGSVLRCEIPERIQRSRIFRLLYAPLLLGGCSFVSSIVFFVLSNFGVWAFTGMYPLTVSGIITCYSAALPFFRYTVTGDFFYGAIFFGSYVCAYKVAQWKRVPKTAYAEVR